MTNIYNEYGSISKNQEDYDSYNSLLFSSERNIFFKMIVRSRLYNLVREINGDIVECGVFKGAGVALWLKLIDLDSPHDIRKVIGFDFFSPGEATAGSDAMSQVFARTNEEGFSMEAVEKKLLQAGFPGHRFELIKGDISKTSVQYAQERPGFRIALLYMDLDLEEPTYNVLVNFWDRIVPGGVIVFDEYGYHIWSESNAVDRFVAEKRLTLHKLNVRSPTAYIVKR